MALTLRSITEEAAPSPAQDLEKQLDAARGKTLIEQCDQMPPLFQAANRCGAYRPR